MKTKTNKKNKKKHTLFGRTDYAVKQVNTLIAMGAIPEEFIEFAPNSGITIDHFITSFLEHFPMRELGDDWLEVCNNSIKYACDLIGFNIASREDGKKFANGETAVLFIDTTRLSPVMNMEKDELDRLIDGVIEHNPDLQPFVMHDNVAGCVVSSFLIKQLQISGVRLDDYLKDMVSGKFRFAVNPSN